MSLFAGGARSLSVARRGAVTSVARRLLSTEKRWNVYLAGEIHTDWREQIVQGSKALDLPIEYSAPIAVHEDSDDAAANVLAHLDQPGLARHFYDDMGARLNAVRTRALMDDADVVVARWDNCKYKQWNAAFDAGLAAAKNIPLITLHPEAFGHMLKEVNAASLASCRTPQQVVDALAYVTRGTFKARDGFVPFAKRPPQALQ